MQLHMHAGKLDLSLANADLLPASAWAGHSRAQEWLAWVAALLGCQQQVPAWKEEVL